MTAGRCAAVLSAGLLAVPLPAQDAPFPDGNQLVRELVGKLRHNEEMFDRYTYDALEVREEVAKDGRVKERRSRSYEVFYVKGRPLRKLVAVNGVPLSAEARAKEERRVTEAAQAIARGQVATEQPRLRLSAILERYDFRTVGREAVEGRSAFRLEFTALPGERKLDQDYALRKLAGRLWVNEEEREVVRVRIHNTDSIKVALGLGATVSSLDFALEFHKVGGEVWLPLRVETEAAGRVLLVKGFRTRRTTSYGNFRRFWVESQEEIRPSPAPSPAASGRQER